MYETESHLIPAAKLVVPIVVGTRPEAIKLVPIIVALRESEYYEPIVISTGRHNRMVEYIFEPADTKPGVTLWAGSRRANLNERVAAVIQRFEDFCVERFDLDPDATSMPDDVLNGRHPAAVLVHNDTSSAMAAALSAFHLRISVMHVEAGLRTGGSWGRAGSGRKPSASRSAARRPPNPEHGQRLQRQPRPECPAGDLPQVESPDLLGVDGHVDVGRKDRDQQPQQPPAPEPTRRRVQHRDGAGDLGNPADRDDLLLRRLDRRRHDRFEEARLEEMQRPRVGQEGGKRQARAIHPPKPTRYVRPVAEFKLNPAYTPTADQPKAIAGLAEGLEADERFQTLLGATGTGKTFTMAATIAAVQRPALVIAHNKTLAAQLCNEFRGFFPDNAVEYFVSYYDYYQPEAYVPAQDLYIEKDSSINDEIDRLRHAATAALFARRDVIIVASVSCIYGIGSPQVYSEKMQMFQVGAEIDRDEVLRKLVKIQYQRNDSVLGRGSFRVRGEVLEIMPSYAESAYRISLFGDVIEGIQHFDPLTGEVLDTIDHVSVWPASHYVTRDETVERAVEEIRAELESRTAELEAEGKQLEAHRLRQRTAYDIEMIKELGFTSGIENYSRILDGRAAGTPPHTLIDYFPDDFVCFVDESHQTIPQIGGMYQGDRSRKQTLIDFGFRLPSAIDNRPLKFDEFLERVDRLVMVSATPGQFERVESSRIVEQIVRPTGIIDPYIEVRETKNQIDDLMNEVRVVAKAGERTLVTTLTKKMAEDLTAYLLEYGIKVRYLHSEIDTLERIQIIRDLRLGEYDVLIGVNLLREGLDLPEVSLVAILDADKEGFLRGETSLVQTIGRAARNVNGRVLMYADRETDAMRAAMSETDRRRAIQLAYNEEHGITPATVLKGISEMSEFLAMEDRAPAKRRRKRGDDFQTPEELEKTIVALEEEMLAAADELRFEEAGRIRDELRELRRDLDGINAGA